MGCSEQLIPMFGLSALEHVVQPKSTLEKLWFLLEHAFTRAHELTTLISFGALGVLVGFRAFKQAFKRYWFIYRLPEVFIVVVVSAFVVNVVTCRVAVGVQVRRGGRRTMRVPIRVLRFVVVVPVIFFRLLQRQRAIGRARAHDLERRSMRVRRELGRSRGA